MLSILREAFRECYRSASGVIQEYFGSVSGMFQDPEVDTQIKEVCKPAFVAADLSHCI